MQFHRLTPAAHRQTQISTQIQPAYFPLFFFSLEYRPLPLKSPSLVHCVCQMYPTDKAAVLCEKTKQCKVAASLKVWLHRLIALTEGRIREKGTLRERILQSFQRNSLKRFGWDCLVLGPTSSVAMPLILQEPFLSISSAGTRQHGLLTPGTFLGALMQCPDIWIHIELVLKISAFN